MAVYTIQDTTLSAIADAIREKTSQISPVEYSGTISPPGGGDNEHFFVKNAQYKLIITPTSGTVMAGAGIRFSIHEVATSTSYAIDDWGLREEGKVEEIIFTSPIDGMGRLMYGTNTSGTKLYANYTITGGKNYKPTEMANVINELNIIPDERLIFSGVCKYRWAYNYANWLFKNFGEKLTTQDITTRDYMFYNSNTLEEIPFDINLSEHNFGIDYAFYECIKLKKIPPIIGEMCSFAHTFEGCDLLEDIPNLTWGKQSDSYGSAEAVFKGCNNLKNIPYIYNLSPSSLRELFYGCCNLQTIPEDYTNTWNWNRLHTYDYAYGGSLFYACYSLRSIPTTMLHNLWNVYTSSYFNMYYQLFDFCYSLDEVKELGVSSASLTSNTFSYTFYLCSRLKDFTFQTNEDGTPQTAKWKNQTIDLSQYVGYSVDTSKKYLLNYNSGITADKEVVDDITYQLLKNDPDWFSIDLAYSRYNHDSAVNTINSLPDCSATGTNIIKFKGEAGSATDGGAINTLTEEEIAVATAKGWTVSLV